MTNPAARTTHGARRDVLPTRGVLALATTSHFELPTVMNACATGPGRGREPRLPKMSCAGSAVSDAYKLT